VVGTSVGLLCIVGGVTSGGSCNPARQFGPLLLAHQWSSLLPYLLGPVVGGIALAALIRLFGLPRPIVCGLCGEPPRDLPAAGSS
jgi:glycerol uptake facilitator-like aquaporin